MPSRQLIRLHHSRPLADRHEALVESGLQNSLRRLAAAPRIVLIHGRIIDVADRHRSISADARNHPAEVLIGNLVEPHHPPLPIPPHLPHIKSQALRRHVRKRVRPILENCLVDAMCLMQMLPPVRRNARVEDVVMAPLDNVDRVNLQVA